MAEVPGGTLANELVAAGPASRLHAFLQLGGFGELDAHIWACALTC